TGHLPPTPELRTSGYYARRGSVPSRCAVRVAVHHSHDNCSAGSAAIGTHIPARSLGVLATHNISLTRSSTVEHGRLLEAVRRITRELQPWSGRVRECRMKQPGSLQAFAKSRSAAVIRVTSMRAIYSE